MRITAFMLVLILLGLSACAPAPTQAPTVVPTLALQPTGSGYPAPTEAVNPDLAYPIGPTPGPTLALQPTDSGYPGPSVASTPDLAYPNPTVDYSNTGPTPTNDPETGDVRAVIYNNGAPVTYTVFFLADVMKDQKTGQELSTSLDRNSAPKAVSDKDGKIEFVNVRPGRYGLTLLNGTSTYLLINPDDGKAILLSVTKGTSTDLKELKFVNLPID